MKHKYLIDDPNLVIHVEYTDSYIKVYRALYRFPDYIPISKKDYLTIVKSIRDVIILGEDIEFKHSNFGSTVFFIKNFCCQLSLEQEKVTLRTKKLDFMFETKGLEYHKKEELLRQVDGILIRGL